MKAEGYNDLSLELQKEIIVNAKALYIAIQLLANISGDFEEAVARDIAKASRKMVSTFSSEKIKESIKHMDQVRLGKQSSFISN